MVMDVESLSSQAHVDYGHNFRKIDSLSLSIHQFPINCLLGLSLLSSSSLILAEPLSDLGLNNFCVCCQKYCGFINTTTLWFPDNIIFLYSSTTGVLGRYGL